MYNTLTYQQHQLPLRSIVLLLRPQADGREMTGGVVRKNVQGDVYLEFRYDVIRVWKLHWRDVAAAGIGALPLAAITDDAEHESKKVIKEINRRMRHDAAAGEIGSLWTATYLLLGLRHSDPEESRIWQGVRQMMDVLRESVTFQEILEEGRQAATLDLLLDLGTQLLGKPKKSVRKRIVNIDDPQRLHELTHRLPQVETWEELLDSPSMQVDNEK